MTADDGETEKQQQQQQQQEEQQPSVLMDAAAPALFLASAAFAHVSQTTVEDSLAESIARSHPGERAAVPASATTAAVCTLMDVALRAVGLDGGGTAQQHLQQMACGSQQPWVQTYASAAAPAVTVHVACVPCQQHVVMLHTRLETTTQTHQPSGKGFHCQVKLDAYFSKGRFTDFPALRTLLLDRLILPTVGTLHSWAQLPPVLSLDSLPSEVLYAVFARMDVVTLCRISQVCKRFRETAEDDRLWETLHRSTFQRPARSEGVTWKLACKARWVAKVALQRAGRVPCPNWRHLFHNPWHAGQPQSGLPNPFLVVEPMGSGQGLPELLPDHRRVPGPFGTRHGVGRWHPDVGSW